MYMFLLSWLSKRFVPCSRFQFFSVHWLFWSKFLRGLASKRGKGPRHGFKVSATMDGASISFFYVLPDILPTWISCLLLLLLLGVGCGVCGGSTEIPPPTPAQSPPPPPPPPHLPFSPIFFSGTPPPPPKIQISPHTTPTPTHSVHLTPGSDPCPLPIFHQKPPVGPCSPCPPHICMDLILSKKILILQIQSILMDTRGWI